MRVRFDLNCFKDEYLREILTKTGYANYFDFLNNNNNTVFTIDIDIGNSKNIENNKIHSNSNINPKPMDIDVNNDNTNVNMSEDDEMNCSGSSSSENINENDCVNHTMNKVCGFGFTYMKKFNSIFLSTENKNLSKSMLKKLKKNRGKWCRDISSWVFPMSSFHFITNDLNAVEKNDTNIENVYEKNKKIYVQPTKEHTDYAKTVVYDKKGNLGIWDHSLHAWVFEKKEI